MNSRAQIDALIEQWAKRGFNESPVRRRGGRRGLTGLSLPKHARWKESRAANGVRSRLTGIVKRTPQVMVRISGGGRGMRRVRAHLAYITRNGKLPAIDQNGDSFQGRDELDDLGRELQSGGFPIAETSARREAFNIILSMPEDTDAEGLRRAAILFASDEFHGHQYALVLHSYDTDPNKDPARHPHVHLCVKARAEDGTRLNPRKQDLQRWRERFAERLREHGIAAAATSRLERLQPNRGEKQSVRYMRARGASFHSMGVAQGQTARAERALVVERHMLERYREIAQLLADSNEQSDRRLATDIGPALEHERAGIGRPRGGPER
jgi:hypothetical protein